MVVNLGKDNSLKKTATCRHCGTINEYWPNEVVTLWEGRDIGGGPDGAKGFKCVGSCGNNIIVQRW